MRFFAFFFLIIYWMKIRFGLKHYFFRAVLSFTAVYLGFIISIFILFNWGFMPQMAEHFDFRGMKYSFERSVEKLSPAKDLSEADFNLEAERFLSNFNIIRNIIIAEPGNRIIWEYRADPEWREKVMSVETSRYFPKERLIIARQLIIRKENGIDWDVFFICDFSSFVRGCGIHITFVLAICFIALLILMLFWFNGFSLLLHPIIELSKRKAKDLDGTEDEVFKNEIDYCVQMITRSRGIIEENLRQMEEMKNLLIGENAKVNRIIEDRSAINQMMYHDLQTPLTVIKGYFEKYKKDPDTRDKFVHYLEKNLAKIDVLLGYILKMHKFESSSYNIVKEKVVLNDIMKDIYADFKPSMDLRKIEFTLSVPDEPFEVEADIESLCAAFENLLHNAQKYTPEGKAVSLYLRKEGSGIRAGVKDSGHGIEEDIRQKLFEPFFRGEKTSTGVGLGLNIVKKIAEMNGIKIGLETGTDFGADFFFIFGSDNGSKRIGL